MSIRVSLVREASCSALTQPGCAATQPLRAKVDTKRIRFVQCISTEFSQITINSELIEDALRHRGKEADISQITPNSWSSYHRSTAKRTASALQPSNGLILEIGARLEDDLSRFSASGAEALEFPRFCGHTLTFRGECPDAE